MSRFGMQEANIRDFLDEMRALAMIEPERQAMLVENIHRSRADAEEERPTPPIGGDPVQLCLDMMRGGEGPCSAVEFCGFLRRMKHPFHVNTLCTLLGKELAMGQLECRMPGTPFYVMSSVFAVCLAYCHECLDYVSAEHILKLSQALELQPSSSEGDGNVGPVTMSRRSRCHPFWDQRQFWTNRFQVEVALGKKELLQSAVFETLSAPEREHEEGAVPFNVLNKSVQLMLNFGVQRGFIVEFVRQTVKMKLFRGEYAEMVESMVRFVEEYNPK